MADRYRLTTPRIEISTEEIMADLIYPVRAKDGAAVGRRRAEHTGNGSARRSAR